MEWVEQDISAMLRAIARAATGNVPPGDALLAALAQLVNASLVIDAELMLSSGGGPALGAAHVWGLRPGQVIHLPRAAALPDKGVAVLLGRLAPLGRWLQAVVAPHPPPHDHGLPHSGPTAAAPPPTLRLGYCVASVLEPTLKGELRLLAACRDAAAVPFAGRDERIVHLLQEPMARLRAGSPPAVPACGTATTGEAAAVGALAALPPYLRRVSSELLTGEGEKQIALRLGFTYNTVHQYIKVIYRRLGVNSRAEFMARMQAGAARRPLPPPGAAAAPDGILATSPHAPAAGVPPHHVPNQES